MFDDQLESFRPTFDAAFTRNGLPEGVSFSRASTATDYSSETLISYVLNAPRSSTQKGLLLEGARTNLTLQSATINTAPWSSSGSVTLNNTVTAPDGTLAYSINTSAVGAAGRFQSVTVVANTTYTLSGYVKEVSGGQTVEVGSDSTAFVGAGKASIVMNPSTGAFVSQNAGVQAYSITNTGNGWWRWEIRCTTGAAQTVMSFICYCTGSVAREVAFWGNQAESGAFASNYIPTTAASVTRAVDVANISILASMGFNNSEGTIIVEFNLEGLNTATTVGARIFQFHGGTANNRFGLVSLSGGTDNGDIAVAMTTGGVAQWGASGTKIVTSPSAGTTYKAAFAYKANDLAACVNGGAITSQATATIPTVTGLGIGNNGYDTAAPYFGWVRRLTYYPQRLPNTQLQALTT